MTKLLIRILFFSPILIFLMYLEYNLGEMPNSYSYKRQSFEEQLDSVEVLVLGNSQMLYGVNPEFFTKKGYNLSNISQTIYYDTRLALKYMDSMPNLKYLLISVYYVSFGEQLYDGLESWRDNFYSQYWDIDFIPSKKMDVGRYSKIFLYTPRSSLYYFRHHFNINLIKGFQKNGYLWQDTASNYLNISNNSGHDRVREHEFAYRENRFEEIKNDLGLLVREAEKRNIIPVIITPPVYLTYSKFADEQRLNRNKKVIQSICDTYHCQYFNFFTDDRFIKSDFFDNDHLNFVGAEKFSRIINEKILERK